MGQGANQPAGQLVKFTFLNEVLHMFIDSTLMDGFTDTVS